MRKKSIFKLIFAIIYIVIGLFFIALPFDFITIPKFIVSIRDWIVFIGGILMLYIGLNYILARRKLAKIGLSSTPATSVAIPAPVAPAQPVK